MSTQYLFKLLELFDNILPATRCFDCCCSLYAHISRQSTINNHSSNNSIQQQQHSSAAAKATTTINSNNINQQQQRSRTKCKIKNNNKHNKTWTTTTMTSTPINAAKHKSKITTTQFQPVITSIELHNLPVAWLNYTTTSRLAVVF